MMTESLNLGRMLKEGEVESDERRERMADDRKTFNAELQSAFARASHRRSTSSFVVRPVAVSEAGPIENDDPIAFRQLVDDPAQYEILAKREIAVNECHHGTLAFVDVIETHAIYGDVAADLRMLSFVRARSADVVIASPPWPRRHKARPSREPTLFARLRLRWIWCP